MATMSETDSKVHEKNANSHEYIAHAINPEEVAQENYRVGFRTLLAVLALCLPNCCAVLVNTTNTTIRYQVLSVGGTQLASWIANGNFLVTLTLGPILGSLSDRLGKKYIMVAACVLGIVGSVLSATAHSVYRIVGGNILTGVANAGCIISIAANQEIMPNRYRPYAMGLNQTVASCVAIMGTFIAAGFVKHNTGGAGGWRWAYYFNAIFYGFSGLCVMLAYWPPPTLLRRENSLKTLLAGIDFIGIAIFAGSLASLMTGLTWGGSTYAWSNYRVVTTLTVGCIGLVLFGLYEWKGTSTGLFDHRMMETWNFPILLFVCAIDGMLLLGVNVISAQEIADMFSTDSVRIAVILCPYLITSTFGCLPAGLIMGKTKSYRTLLVAALVWTSLWLGLIAIINPQRLGMWYAFSALFGIGTAVTTVIPIVALALSVPSFLLGTAGTLSISCRALGGIVGITIFTAIFDNKLAPQAAKDVGAVLTANHVPVPVDVIIGAAAAESVAVLEKIGLSEAVAGQVLGAYGTARRNSWTYVWVALCLLVLLNAAVSCLLKPVKARMNDHVESAIERSETRDMQMQATRK